MINLPRLKLDKNSLLIFLIGLTFIVLAIVSAGSPPPTIDFVTPTDSNATNKTDSSIFVNLSTSDLDDHYSFMDFNNDVLLWIPMDFINGTGGVLDNSTYSSNATNESGAFQDAGGNFGSAFNLDGSNDFLSIPNQARFNQPLEITLSVWVNIDAFYDSTCDNTVIASKSRDDAEGFMGLMIGDLKAQECSGAVDNPRALFRFQSTIQRNAYGNTDLSTGTWYHIVGTYNGSTSRVYLDGELDNETVFGVGIPSNNADILIGKQPITGFEFFLDGLVDEFLYFNRTLTQIEVRALYNASSYQYQNNFTNLLNGTYVLTAHTVDSGGLFNRTSRTVFIDEVGAPVESDSCTYTSGTWNVDCADNCVIDSDVTIDGSRIIITGTGTFIVNGGVDITGWSSVYKLNTCHYYNFGSGGFIQ